MIIPWKYWHTFLLEQRKLAFISEATLATVPDLRESDCRCLFSSVLSACESISVLAEAECEAIELMDYASLLSIRNLDGVPPELESILVDHQGVMGILFEFQAASSEALEAKVASFQQSHLSRLSTLQPIRLTRNPRSKRTFGSFEKGCIQPWLRSCAR